MATTYVLGSHDMVDLNQTSTPWGAKSRLMVLENMVDFAQENVTGDTDGIVQALAVPANCAVLHVWLNVITPDAGVTDIDVGLADGVEFMEQVSCATAGVKNDVGSAGFGGGTTAGLLFTAADTIDISIQGVLVADTLKLKIFALVVDLTA